MPEISNSTPETANMEWESRKGEMGTRETKMWGKGNKGKGNRETKGIRGTKGNKGEIKWETMGTRETKGNKGNNNGNKGKGWNKWEQK